MRSVALWIDPGDLSLMHVSDVKPDEKKRGVVEQPLAYFTPLL
jgi:hypothetical protein